MTKSKFHRFLVKSPKFLYVWRFSTKSLVQTPQTRSTKSAGIKHVFLKMSWFVKIWVLNSTKITKWHCVDAFFSQKLTSWVFNDQPCECADVGQSRTIGRAAKIGWEKKWSRKWYPRFLSVKSLIGRFYWEETGDRRVIADPAARIRFYLHKEFRAAEIWFSLHKECPAAESWFSLHTLFRGLCEIL